MGFFDYGWLSEHLFEQQMLGLEEHLKDGGEAALKELRHNFHKIIVSPKAEHIVKTAREHYGILCTVFHDESIGFHYAEMRTCLSNPYHLFEFDCIERIKKYFALLDKFVKTA